MSSSHVSVILTLFQKWGCDNKHADWRKDFKNMKGKKKGELYISNDYKHNKNVATYACKWREFVL